MTKKGIITTWNDADGYGFIKPDAGGSEVFVHSSELRGISRKHAVGTRVIYNDAVDAEDRLSAEEVRPVYARASSGAAVTAFIIAALFFGAVAVGVAQDLLPPATLWLYGGSSALTFIVYAIDKAAARSSGPRVPEVTLHLLALLGGWPGALYAQQLLRHKSRKPAFRIAFRMTLIFNLAALGYLVSARGQWLLAMFS